MLSNAKQCSQMGLLVHFSMMQLKKFPYLSDALDPRPSCPAPESRLFKAERGGGRGLALTRKKPSPHPKEPANCLFRTSAFRSCLFQVCDLVCPRVLATGCTMGQGLPATPSAVQMVQTAVAATVKTSPVMGGRD